VKVSGIVAVYIHLFLTTALHAGNWLALLARSLKPQEHHPRYKLNRKLVLSRSGSFEEDSSLVLLLLGIGTVIQLTVLAVYFFCYVSCCLNLHLT
jgi:hypothetical protein